MADIEDDDNDAAGIDGVDDAKDADANPKDVVQTSEFSVAGRVSVRRNGLDRADHAELIVALHRAKLTLGG